MAVGTLIYSVVLGFFNDYTNIVAAKSFSTIFLAALVMQVLTYLTFMLKDAVVGWFSPRQGKKYKLAMVFCVWFIVFSSKFVFLWALDWAFGHNIDISGFLGILAVIACTTVFTKLADYTFIKLGND